MKFNSSFGLCCCALAFVSCSSASLTELTPGTPGMGGMQLWVALSFDKELKSGNPLDVRLEVKSDVFESDLHYDWAFIAEHDVVALGNFKGYGPNNDTRAEAAPEVGGATRILLESIPYKKNISGDASTSIEAILYWGGKKQDSRVASAGNLYMYDNKTR